jgi:hypothetical protein
VRPARLLVHKACSGQTWQARPKWATPVRVHLHMSFGVRLDV